MLNAELRSGNKKSRTAFESVGSRSSQANDKSIALLPFPAFIPNPDG
jgi:hypothetical protein